MSEEQPVFKVTDRRLFNADGTPRDVPPEEAAKTQSAEAKEKASSTASDTPPSASKAPAEEAQAAGAPETTATDSASAGAIEQPSEDDYVEGDIPGADDPASFINFLMSIASNAAAALGMMEHPVTGQRALDPELGKHWIDVLGMLQQKTRGNLTPQEQQIFEGLLADLRMQYVSLTSTRQPRAPRGFTGSDITGGR
ncbi:MAG TPA: DUF1844 domain-containing protein [Pyrinomonadaceae bacterium]